MQVDLNLELRLEAKGGFLTVSLIQKGTYPHFDESIVAEASVPLSDLWEPDHA